MARLMFACATEFEADILVLDEWLSAGDAAFMQKASDRMATFVEKAKIMVLGTHDFGLVKRTCNKVMVLDSGRVAFYGDLKLWEELGGDMNVRQPA
jgi:lipopolysaccharide transport system ATP-binding protein